MFGMVIERLMIPDIQKISGAVERKITAVGLTKLLCEASELIDGQYSTYWWELQKLPTLIKGKKPLAYLREKSLQGLFLRYTKNARNKT